MRSMMSAKGGFTESSQACRTNASTVSSRSAGIPSTSRDLSSTPSSTTPPALLAKAASSSAKSSCVGPRTLPPANFTCFSSRKLSSPSRIFSINSARVASMSNLLAQTHPAAGKCFSAAFHHPADLLAHGLLLQGAALLNQALAATELHHMHQFGIAIHHHVGVVSDHDELPTQLVLADLAHDQIV